MTGCVGILCAEGRSEGVNIAECHCISLDVQLSAYGQVRWFSEEILGEVDRAVLVLRDVVQIHRCNLEHLTCALAVTSGDQRSVNVNETALLEELVNCISDQGANTEYSLEGVGACS